MTLTMTIETVKITYKWIQSSFAFGNLLTKLADWDKSAQIVADNQCLCCNFQKTSFVIQSIFIVLSDEMVRLAC